MVFVAFSAKRVRFRALDRSRRRFRSATCTHERIAFTSTIDCQDRRSHARECSGTRQRNSTRSRIRICSTLPARPPPERSSRSHSTGSASVTRVGRLVANCTAHRDSASARYDRSKFHSGPGTGRSIGPAVSSIKIRVSDSNALTVARVELTIGLLCSAIGGSARTVGVGQLCGTRIHHATSLRSPSSPVFTVSITMVVRPSGVCW